MKNERIIEFAVSQGYDDIVPLGKWRGYDIYEPIMYAPDIVFIGPPLIIMTKGDTIRMSTPEESFEQLHDE